MTEQERVLHNAKVHMAYAEHFAKHGVYPKVEHMDTHAEKHGDTYLSFASSWHELRLECPPMFTGRGLYRLAPEPPLVVEVGQWYETRDGRAACAAFAREGDWDFSGFVIHKSDRVSTASWRKDGRCSPNREYSGDLIRRIDAPAGWAEFIAKWVK